MSIIKDNDPRIKELNMLEKKHKDLLTNLLIKSKLTPTQQAVILKLMDLSEQLGVLNYRIELDL
jgi:hypothetical protein